MIAYSWTSSRLPVSCIDQQFVYQAQISERLGCKSMVPWAAYSHSLTAMLVCSLHTPLNRGLSRGAHVDSASVLPRESVRLPEPRLIYLKRHLRDVFRKSPSYISQSQPLEDYYCISFCQTPTFIDLWTCLPRCTSHQDFSKEQSLHFCCSIQLSLTSANTRMPTTWTTKP